MKRFASFGVFYFLLIFVAGILPIIMNISGKRQKCSFACAINCIDGRTQRLVEEYILKKYGVDFVDAVTEPGPDKILAENTDVFLIESIKKKVGISVKHHGAKIIAIVGHADCAGNPSKKEDHLKQLRESKKTVESFGFNANVISLWIDENLKKAKEVE